MSFPDTLLGDIWKHRRARDWVVVPTNIGWKTDGSNVMGAGIARDAAKLYVPLAGWYGALCQQHKEHTPTLAHPDWKLILFPTKPLAAGRPWQSWKQPSTVQRITQSLNELVVLVPNLPRGGRILVPAVGCGCGGLDPAVIVPLLLDAAQYRCERLTLVLRPQDAAKVPCYLCEGQGGGCQWCRDSGVILPMGWRDPGSTAGFNPHDPFGLGLHGA